MSPGLHRKEVIGAAQELAKLDGTEVLKQERVFLHRLRQRVSSRALMQTHDPAPDGVPQKVQLVTAHVCHLHRPQSMHVEAGVSKDLAIT